MIEDTTIKRSEDRTTRNLAASGSQDYFQLSDPKNNMMFFMVQKKS